jgi:hypothetical protein
MDSFNQETSLASVGEGTEIPGRWFQEWVRIYSLGLRDAGQLIEDGDGVVEKFLVTGRESMNMLGERLDATVAGKEEEAFAPGGRSDVNDATVGGAGVFCDEVFGLKGVNNAGHGGRANLLRVSELAEGDGPCENDDGESRETGGIEAG